MSKIRIYGDTSGYVDLAAPAVADNRNIDIAGALDSKLDTAGGKILQIVRATDSTERSTTSTSTVDIPGMSITITPQKSDSAIIVALIVEVWNDAGADSNGTYLMITDSSNSVISGAEEGIGAAYLTGYTGSGTRRIRGTSVIFGYDTPATTSAVTYKLRGMVDTASTTLRVRNDRNTGQMYALEVSA